VEEERGEGGKRWRRKEVEEESGGGGKRWKRKEAEEERGKVKLAARRKDSICKGRKEKKEGIRNRNGEEKKTICEGRGGGR
jgi:hypothetical protein